MCRSKGSGGRRCVAKYLSSPQALNEHNAKRRWAYAVKKGPQHYLKRILSIIEQQEMPPETAQVILSYAHQYGAPSWGRERVVFDTADGYVLKVAYTWDGFTSNGREMRHHSGADADFIPLASCAWHKNPEHDLQEQVSIIKMEKVTPFYASYDDLPSWVGYVDGAQVGHTAEGKLVAYDL